MRTASVPLAATGQAGKERKNLENIDALFGDAAALPAKDNRPFVTGNESFVTGNERNVTGAERFVAGNGPVVTAPNEMLPVTNHLLPVTSRS